MSNQTLGTNLERLVDNTNTSVMDDVNHAVNVSIVSGGSGGTTVVTQPTGTNLHTVVDSGTITAVTGITNPLPAGTNVIGHVINDSGSTTVVTGTVAVTGTFFQSTQPISGTVTGLVNQNNLLFQSFTEGSSSVLSSDLQGFQRVRDYESRKNRQLAELNCLNNINSFLTNLEPYRGFELR